MKTATQSMTPREAANAFYGQENASFDEMIARLTQGDPRLVKAFNNTRERFLGNTYDPIGGADS